jgi:hypothetical protein
MNKIKLGTVHPSAAFCLNRKYLRWFTPHDKKPEVGDVIFGEVILIGEHSNLENKSGRIHVIHRGSKGVFVFGNRYAPDYYEGWVPDAMPETVDLLSRSGVVGRVVTKNILRKDPTKVRVLGYVCDENGTVVNTRLHPLVRPKQDQKKFPRAKMILVCGTTMNAGKSMAAVACCWALSSQGHNVRASKVTGTASLKDILYMNDAGANHFSDFTFLGFPSTYLLSNDELIGIFNKLDLKFANNPKNYWVVELADGLLQRETRYLLKHPEVRKRIHKLIFCSSDALGAIGGLTTIQDEFELRPDLISGICSSSPLHIKELSEFTNIPVLNSADADAAALAKYLTH